MNEETYGFVAGNGFGSKHSMRRQCSNQKRYRGTKVTDQGPEKPTIAQRNLLSMMVKLKSLSLPNHYQCFRHMHGPSSEICR